MQTWKFCPRCGGGLNKVEIDGAQRLRCADGDCGFVYWNNPLPVVAAIIEHEGMMLLVRNVGWPEKLFGLVTGFLEQGEAPRDGVAREVKEELGLDTSHVDLVGLYPFERQNQLIIAFYLRCEGRVVLNDELAEVKRVPRERLRPWPFGTGLAVADWIASLSG